MSSLIVVHDSRMILLEVAVKNLYMPWTDVFDAALMKRTVILFRMLDDEWTTLMPHRRDYRSYRGSNYENEQFYGGRSVLFALPEAALEERMSGVDLQLYVYKGVSKYFELEPRQNFGFTLLNVDDLLNGIIKDLGERKELKGYFSDALEREPISRSTRGTFTLLDEDLQETKATIELYVRISYLGKCIINEMHRPYNIEKAFYAREEQDEHFRYQFRALTIVDLESFCWGSQTILPPLHPDRLICDCKPLEPIDDSTQTKKKKKRKRKDDYLARLAEVMRLLELMKKMRANRPDIMALGERKKVCPPAPCPTICPSPCPPVCVYTLPSVCPTPCQPTNACCLPRTC
ncbi:hypothetical protein ANTQUA_LOCUS8618 [Anthophora quadrimaculata]